MSAVA